MSSILSLFRETAADAVQEHASAVVEEGEHRLALQAREKVSNWINYTDSAADSALTVTEIGSSRFSFLKPVKRMLEKASEKVKRSKTKNSEEIENEKESLAWSTIKRIGTKKIMSTALTAEIAAEGVPAASELSSFLSSEPTPKKSPSKKETRFKWPEALKKIKIPHIKLPESLKLPRCASRRDSGTFSLLNVRYPDMDFSFPEGPDLGLPDLSLPTMPDLTLPQVPEPSSLPSLPPLAERVLNVVIDKAIEKAVGKEESLLMHEVGDPRKDELRQFTQKMEESFGTEGEEFLKAAEVIIDHRTARCQEQLGSLRGWVRGGVEKMHHRAMDLSCCFTTVEV